MVKALRIDKPWIIAHENGNDMQFVLPRVSTHTVEGHAIVVAELIRHMAKAYGTSHHEVLAYVLRALDEDESADIVQELDS